MILSDSVIVDEALKQENLVIRNWNRKHLQNTSVDVRLGKNMIKIVNYNYIDPKKPAFNQEESFILKEEGTIIVPYTLYLGVLLEHFEIGKGLVGIFEGVSSLARLGLTVHLTAGYCDAGFKGHPTLEITTVYPFALYPNMVIGQMIFARVEGEVKNPYNEKKINYCNDFSQDPMPIPSNYHLKF